MSGLVMWVACFGVVQLVGWLFYWRFDKPRFSGLKPKTV
jgi:hypothetical protein